MHRRLFSPLLAAGLASALFGCRAPANALSHAEALALYATPLAPPRGKLSVFHLGHSLVGRDMPAMLAGLAGGGHASHSQLGWGSSLKDHWTKNINGYAAENAHPAARPAPEALDSGVYQAVVFTEMVEIRDAIRFHQSADYLQRWAQRAWDGNADVRLYLYETWPQTNDPEGWLNRVEKDLTRYWENDILLPAVQALGRPIYLIPGGQALATTVRAVMARGQVDGVSRIEDFFATTDQGSSDTIHFNDLGAYVIALTHYAVIYHASPIGLPRTLQRADGTPATAPGPQLAKLIQQSVWSVVRRSMKTGLAA